MKQLITPKQFYKDLYHWIDGDITDGEIRYFKTKKEFVKFLKKNREFGVFHYILDDDEPMSTFDTRYNLNDRFSNIRWSGPGDYVAWCWGEDHIERIDEVYEALIEDYKKVDFEPPTDEMVEEMYNECYKGGINI